jgi:hypothetical protein
VPVQTFTVMCKITKRNKIKNDKWGVMGNLPGGRINAERVLVNQLEGRGRDGTITLKWILQKYDKGARTGVLNGKNVWVLRTR